MSEMPDWWKDNPEVWENRVQWEGKVSEFEVFEDQEVTFTFPTNTSWTNTLEEIKSLDETYNCPDVEIC